MDDFVDNIEGNSIEQVNDDDDAKYRLTEHFILYLVLKEYGIAVGEWYPTLWNHLYDDFMKQLEQAGYIEKAMEER